ncbi:hypothetical protein T484DRAFT_1868151, partial [Baffinella frigidus]
MGSACSIQRSHVDKRAKRNPVLEQPVTVKDPARVAKAYAVTAMHFDVMRKGFRNAVAASFETSRQALNSHHKQRTNEERALLAEEGKRQRDADGAAALPDGCAKFLCPEERVRLKLAEPSRSKAQVKALTPAQKRQRALQRGALSAVLTGRMLAEPGFKSADAARVALERGFPDLTSKILHTHFKAHPGEAPGHVGTPCIFGPAQEDKIVLWVQAMRCFRCQITKHSVIARVHASIANTPLEKCFNGGAPTMKWDNGFLERHSLDLGIKNVAMGEGKRHEWTTSRNLIQFYDLLFETLELEEIAYKNPAFDASVPLRAGGKDSNEHQPEVTPFTSR